MGAWVLFRNSFDRSYCRSSRYEGSLYQVGFFLFVCWFFFVFFFKQVAFIWSNDHKVRILGYRLVCFPGSFCRCFVLVSFSVSSGLVCVLLCRAQVDEPGDQIVPAAPGVIDNTGDGGKGWVGDVGPLSDAEGWGADAGPRNSVVPRAVPREPPLAGDMKKGGEVTPWSSVPARAKSTLPGYTPPGTVPVGFKRGLGSEDGQGYNVLRDSRGATYHYPLKSANRILKSANRYRSYSVSDQNESHMYHPQSRLYQRPQRPYV